MEKIEWGYVAGKKVSIESSQAVLDHILKQMLCNLKNLVYVEYKSIWYKKYIL